MPCWHSSGIISLVSQWASIIHPTGYPTGILLVFWWNRGMKKKPISRFLVLQRLGKWWWEAARREIVECTGRSGSRRHSDEGKGSPGCWQRAGGVYCGSGCRRDGRLASCVGAGFVCWGSGRASWRRGRYVLGKTRWLQTGPQWCWKNWNPEKQKPTPKQENRKTRKQENKKGGVKKRNVHPRTTLLLAFGFPTEQNGGWENEKKRPKKKDQKNWRKGQDGKNRN